MDDQLFEILKRHALDLWGVINAEDKMPKQEEQRRLDDCTWEAINKIKSLMEET